MPDKKAVRTPPFQSRLIPYEKEIMHAWFQRKTLKEISQSLESKYDITVPLSTLGAFIKRRRNRPDPHSSPTVPSAAPVKKTAPKKIDPAIKERLRQFAEKDPLDVQKEFDRAHRNSPLQEVSASPKKKAVSQAKSR